jgi:predicted DNA binding CopG/RHH family protein
MLTVKEELKKKSFRSEAEEAQWWDENQDSLAQEFEQAAAEGTLGRGTTARRGNTPTTTIRLDPRDIDRARIEAESRGLKYQTYLKMLIHEALWQRTAKAVVGKQRGKLAVKDMVFAKRRHEGDFAVQKPESKRVVASFSTREKAVEKVRKLSSDSDPAAQRVRRTSAGKPDQWRKP